MQAVPMILMGLTCTKPCASRR